MKNLNNYIAEALVKKHIDAPSKWPNYVDLGLPSGTLWEQVDLNNPIECKWYDANKKINGTFDNKPKEAYLPTKQQVMELKNNTLILKDDKFIYIISKINKNRLVFNNDKYKLSYWIGDGADMQSACALYFHITALDTYVTQAGYKLNIITCIQQ